MKLTRQCRYAVRAVLTIAKNYKKCPTTRKEIASAQHVTEFFLENILSVLKKHKILSSLRGKRGGFVLNRAPEEITVYDIIKTFLSDLSPVECLVSNENCERKSSCVTRIVWNDMYKAQKQVLKSYTIKKLLDMENSIYEPD